MLLEYKVKSEYFFPLFADNLFGELTTKSLESLAGIKQTKQFQKGVRLFAAGEVPNRIYLLVKGEAQLLFSDESKDIHIARLIKPNEIFGLTEAIISLPYKTGAETITSCICECVESEDFMHFLQDEPEVCFRLLQLLSSNLQKSYQLYGY